MENFSPITLKDKELFDKYSKFIKSKSYEYSFSSLYLWRNLCNIKYSILDNSLIIKKNEEGKGQFFMMPFGYKKENLQFLVENLKSIENKSTEQIYLFGDIETSFINDLSVYTNFKLTVIDDRDDYEYIYRTEDLINLSGKKYHAKKNYCNYFTTHYKYDIKSIDKDFIVNDCINLLYSWHAEKKIFTKELSVEIGQIENLLWNLDFLKLSSIAIYANNVLIGFSIGEKVNDTAIIHVERCDTKYRGIYPFINREFLKLYFSDTTFINRQEDCGNLGLRKSKNSYHPCELLKKSLIIIH